MLDLREQLQSALGSAYDLRREMGGGGMSRVFVAHEASLGRDVVVKVLHPELAGGLSVERFKREIQLAAQLQHPHIVPILSAGDSGGLPYFTMPFVQGRSLRERLAEAVGGAGLPVAEAVSVLRDVARALAYAHGRGVVHRDIKPDNVLLAEGAATVTDFGVAKALSSARTADGGATLTSVGTSIGTPAYMAPEQAAGDPDVDHRADLYAWGVMAYELLAGRPPFHGRTPHRLLAAHMSEAPTPLADHRPDVPRALADLVMRCLAKDPAARPQSAGELVQLLDAVRTPSGDGLETRAAVSLANRRTLGRALALYAAAFVAVALVAWVAIGAIGLPDWVFPGALIVMALGLPVVLFTGLVHHQSHRARTASAVTPGGSPARPSGLTTLAVRARPHVTWRRTALGVGAAVLLFAALVAGYMTMRALGVGPAGTLMAAGVLGHRDRVLIADFAGPPSDTLLGAVMTEALRTDLGQSRAISVVSPQTVQGVLQRMRRPANARLDLSLARDVATREGVKAVLHGEIAAAGVGYVLSARLISTESGEVLAALRENAAGGTEVIPALGRLSRSLRAKMGESLKSVRETPPLARVTTSSLDALRKYVQGDRAWYRDGDFGRGVSLMEEAVALDTAFALAYNGLGVMLSNQGGQLSRQYAAIEKAFAHRDRLTERERYIVTGTYYLEGPTRDPRKGIEAFEALLELDSTSSLAWNQIGLTYSVEFRDYARSERYFARALALDSTAIIFSNLARSQLNQGKVTEARATIARMAKRYPGHPRYADARYREAFAVGQYDSAAAVARRLWSARRADPVVRAQASRWLARTATVRGRLREAERWHREEAEGERERGSRAFSLVAALMPTAHDIWFRDRPEAGVRAMDDALARQPLDSLPLVERPYGTVAIYYAIAGRPERAQALLARMAEDSTRVSVTARAANLARVRGEIALAERRYDDAIAEMRTSDRGICGICDLPPIARAYDAAGRADSALAIYERYVLTPSSFRSEADYLYLAGALKRLGELYEAKGDKEKAASAYARFVELWKDADPDLQPRVAEVRRRLAAIQRAEGR